MPLSVGGKTVRKDEDMDTDKLMELARITAEVVAPIGETLDKVDDEAMVKSIIGTIVQGWCEKHDKNTTEMFVELASVSKLVEALEGALEKEEE